MAPFFLAGLSGLLLSTSYIPFYPWALFFCLVPLISAWSREESPWRAFALGWICQFIFNLVGFHWIYHTAREFGHLPVIPSAIALAGFASFGSLDLPLSGMAVVAIKKKVPLRPAFEAALYMLVFFIFQWLYPTIFPWNLGYPWYWARWPAVQWADVFGFEGLSLLTLLSQVLFWKIWRDRRKIRSVARLAVLFLAAIVSLNVTGRARGQKFEQKIAKDGSDLSVLIVQANIGNLEKAYAERGLGYQDYIVGEYLDLAREGLARYPEAQLVVFPETALPISLNSEYRAEVDYQKVTAFVRGEHRALLTGGFGETIPQSNPYNGVFLFDADGALVGTYNKTQLLAFGEYIPMGDLVPKLYQWMPFISHFSRGNGPGVIAWNSLTFGIQICYEGLYPGFSRKLVDKGAGVFFNATNDSWFGKAFEPEQHLVMTAARSLEFRRPLIRATNTGISTVVSATGSFGTLSPLNEKWYGLYKLKVLKNGEPTLYARFPFVVFFVAVVLFFLCLYFGRSGVVEPSAS
jgi:apolipoprotein N-acyltransferase